MTDLPGPRSGRRERERAVAGGDAIVTVSRAWLAEQAAKASAPVVEPDGH